MERNKRYDDKILNVLYYLRNYKVCNIGNSISNASSYYFMGIFKKTSLI